MKKILIIEDDQMVIRILENYFAKLEVEILLASHADEGIQKAQANNPDLIILDMMIGNQSGLDILKEIKGSSVTASIPVVMFSAVDQEDIIAQAKILGAADYIVKGAVPLEQILKRMKKYL